MFTERQNRVRPLRVQSSGRMLRGGGIGDVFRRAEGNSSTKDRYMKAKQHDLWQWIINYTAQSLEETSRFNELR